MRWEEIWRDEMRFDEIRWDEMRWGAWMRWDERRWEDDMRRWDEELEWNEMRWDEKMTWDEIPAGEQLENSNLCLALLIVSACACVWECEHVWVCGCECGWVCVCACGCAWRCGCAIERHVFNNPFIASSELSLTFNPISLHDAIRVNTYTGTLICYLAVPLTVFRSISIPRPHIDWRICMYTSWLSRRITRMQCNCTARLLPYLQRTHTYSLLRTSRLAFTPHTTLHLWSQSTEEHLISCPPFPPLFHSTSLFKSTNGIFFKHLLLSLTL